MRQSTLLAKLRLIGLNSFRQKEDVSEDQWPGGMEPGGCGQKDLIGIAALGCHEMDVRHHDEEDAVSENDGTG